MVADMIDSFYTDIDKSNYYLGLVSQVYKDNIVIQVENLSWLNYRRLKQDLLVPGTVNYFVLIDSVNGIFLGEVTQAKLPGNESVHQYLLEGSSEKVYPELNIDIVAVYSDNEEKFIPAGFETVELTNKTYVANEIVTEIFYSSLNVNIETQKEEDLPTFAVAPNYGNREIAFKPSTLFDRHLMCIGTTNSGKSTTALAVLDKLIGKHKKVLIIDPTGEYRDAFKENYVEKLTLGPDTVVDTGSISFTQWATLFETNDTSQPAVLADAIKSLRYQFKNGKSEVYVKKGRKVADVQMELSSLNPTDSQFELNLLAQQITEEAVELDKNQIKYQSGAFQFNQKQWLVQKIDYKLKNSQILNFFTKNPSKKQLLEEVDKFIEGDIESLYINASEIGIGDEIGAVIIDLLSTYIMDHKKKDSIGFVVFIDEVHRYFGDVNRRQYQRGLTYIAREGRKKGIFLFLTSQNPQDVPNELLGQIGTLFVHRLTYKEDLETIRNHLSYDAIKQVPKLNKGEAILTSINLMREIELQIIRCSRMHHNSTVKL